jgi:uncharacterized protein (UPF0261 family)
MKTPVYAIGTLDTKGAELAFVARCIEEAGGACVLVDVGTGAPPTVAPGITRETVASFHPSGADAVLSLKDRGTAVTAMGEALAAFLADAHSKGLLAGAIGLGGTGGTALVSAGLRKLPVGFPKVLVSTVASGNTFPYVGTSDITMMNSIVDIAGLNRVSRSILSSAAGAVLGMAIQARPTAPESSCGAAGLTMFGVTTPCVNAVRENLESEGWECLVFHATGTGGQSMEKLARSGLLDFVVDLTTTEVADELVGGVFPAGPERFDYLAEKDIPCVMSLGALDMVNFGAPETVPAKFADRLFHRHNANVTLMRTSPEENRACARWIAAKINRSRAPLVLLIPEGGVSLLDAPGQPFFDREADNALFETLELLVECNSRRILRRIPHAINAPEFAEAVIAACREIRTSQKS